MQDGSGWADGGLDQLSPIGRETVQDRIYRQLRSALIRGGFVAGETFLAGEVASRMSVSSMPVREALARLVSECALEAMPNRRVRVPLLTLDRGRDIAAARCMIECDLARRAMTHLSQADINELEDLTQAYDAADDPREVSHLNHAFHFAIYNKSGSSVLLPFVESLWMQAGPYVRAAARQQSVDSIASATRHHHGILGALRKGDSVALTAALEADIRTAFAILEAAGDEFWAEQEAAA
tara:strand:- start:144129 stop:144845 length:717 start_codon:yes stop_codon:yes gene_type:complete